MVPSELDPATALEGPVPLIARQVFDTLMTDAKNQSVFLGHDLNASAIASLKPDAAKFNGRANEIFAKVDNVTKMFDEYIASLKP